MIEIDVEMESTETQQSIPSPEEEVILEQLNIHFPKVDYRDVAAQKAGVSEGELSNDWQGWVRDREQGEKFYRANLARTIAQHRIAPEDVGRYVAGVQAFVQEVGERTGIDTVERQAKTFSTVEDIEAWATRASDWKRRFVEPVAASRNVANEHWADFHQILNGIKSNKFPSSTDSVDRLFETLASVHEYYYTHVDPSHNTAQLRQWKTNLVDLGIWTGDPEQVRRLFNISTRHPSVPPPDLYKFSDAVARYAKRHSNLTEVAAQGFEDKLLPAIVKKDPQVACLLRSGNIWGMKKGDFGIADFTCQAYSSSVKSAAIQELLMTVREVPTTSFAKFEQNRLDAFSLAGTFGALRDFIHDQRPLVHDVLRAMLDYYETGNDADLKRLLPETGGYLGSPDRQAVILDRARYGGEVVLHGTQLKEPVITILHRLIENTFPTVENPAPTGHSEIDSALTELAESNQRIKISKEQLSKTFDVVNTELLKRMREHDVGIEPNLVLSLAWLERQQFEVLRDLTYEEQRGAYKSVWLQSVLKFQELTASPEDFDESEFTAFLQKLNEARSDQEGYQLIFERTIDHVSKLADRYKKDGRSQRADALWSGNTAHELISLGIPREATTVLGKRLQKEALLPREEQLRGD